MNLRGMRPLLHQLYIIFLNIFKKMHDSKWNAKKSFLRARNNNLLSVSFNFLASNHKLLLNAAKSNFAFSQENLHQIYKLLQNRQFHTTFNISLWKSKCDFHTSTCCIRIQTGCNSPISGTCTETKNRWQAALQQTNRKQQVQYIDTAPHSHAHCNILHA